MDEPVWSTGGRIMTRRNLKTPVPVLLVPIKNLKLAWNRTLAPEVKSWQLNWLSGGMAYQNCCYN